MLYCVWFLVQYSVERCQSDLRILPTCKHTFFLHISNSASTTFLLHHRKEKRSFTFLWYDHVCLLVMVVFLLLSFHVSLVTWFRNFCTFCFLTYMTWHCHCLSPPFILLASFHVSTVEVNFLYGCFAAKSDELVCFGNREIKICLLRIHTKHQNNIFLSRKLKGNLRLTL